MKFSLIFSVATLLLYLSLFSQTRTDSIQEVIQFGKYLDINLTEAEADSLLGNLQGQKRRITQLHEGSIPNNLPYPFGFQPFNSYPLPSGSHHPGQWKIPAAVKMPENKSDLAFYSVLELASLLRQNKITSVALTSFFIDRLKKYNDTLLCVISFTEDIAMKQAAKADAELKAGIDRGPLHGIPYGLKDLFAVQGTRTTFGTEPFKNQVIDEDAFVYQQLQKAGAVLCAKLSLGELAFADRWFGGVTKNPWDLTQGSSGSSAGSAASVSAGLLPFAIGTETYGSIISPSMRCGTVGLRPSFGAVSRSGAMVLSWSLDKIGPITRNAKDAAIVYDYIKGTDSVDPSAVDYPFKYLPPDNINTLKIGVAENYYRNIPAGNPLFEILQKLKDAGISLHTTNFPDSGSADSGLMSIIISAESAAAFDELTRSNRDDMLARQDKGFWPNSFRAARFIPAVEYINANRHRYSLMQKIYHYMNDYDVVIIPGAAGTSVAITNLTGNPMISLPIGLGSNGKPVSITLVGKMYHEAAILAVAEKIQELTGAHLLKPPIFIQ